jgi:hypothetical protein
MQHEMRANTATAVAFCAAVALTGNAAAIVSFQWQSASFPPIQNVNSALRSLTSTGQFRGSIAIYAANAKTSTL